MSTRSQLTKDLNESIKTLLGKHVKTLLKIVVKLETKGDKTENRVLVYSPCRLFILTAKVPTRIDIHFHYLEIQAVESKRPNQLSFTVGDKVYSFQTVAPPTVPEEGGSPCSTAGSPSADVETMVLTLASALKSIFPTVPLEHIIRKVDLGPNEGARRLLSTIHGGETVLGGRYIKGDARNGGAGGNAPSSSGVGPCGGFSTQYACMCDYHNMPYRDEVAWDVDTIYLSHDTRELSLKDFDHLDQKDLVPIISALEHNTWFTKLRASNIKLSHEALERILHVMKKSLSIEELHLDNLGVRWDFAHKLSLSLIANTNTPLHTIDLSNNMIEDKGASSLCGIIAKIVQGASHLSNPIAKVSKGLVHLNLSHCYLSSKGVNQIAHALSLNKYMPNTLTYLNLAGNCLRDEVNNLYNFLAQPNTITHLDISGTDSVLETVFGALLRGCTTTLAHLNVSRNIFNTKKGKEVPPSFKQFFTSTLSLKHLNMSHCKLPLEALKNLLLGLACNESTTDIELDLSSNNLSAQGAHVLESCIHGVRSVGSLDISDNNMDVELASVVTAVSKNKSIKHLNLGRNLINMKAKHIACVMEAVVQMIQEEDCVLQSLSIPDSKLKSDLYNLINALGSNQCLQSIDISGNLMGDGGAKLLAKALQINSRLRNIIYDRNNITLQGYADLAYAMESNFTLRYMPFPVFDIMPCMKVSAERTEIIMRRIQDLLHRNVSPKKYSNGQAFRLQQGFLLSSTQQMVDRLVVQTQDTIRTLSREAAAAQGVDIEHALGLTKDADNSKQLLPRLQEVVQRREEAGNPIDIKLKQVSEELHGVITSYLQGTLENMMKCAEDQCPHVLSDERVQGEIQRTCLAKSAMPADFVQMCVMEQTGTEIMNKVNELNLAVAAHVSDRITDEVIESLSRCYKSLIGDTSKKRSSTPDVLRTRSRVGSSESSSSSSKTEQGSGVGGGGGGGTIVGASDYSNTGDDVSQKSDQSPMATPHLSTKRKSLHGRKLRPKSVVDSVDGLSADDIPDLLPSSLPKSAEESMDSVSELPSEAGLVGGGGVRRLQHLAKGRPRRAKTRAPSRPMLPHRDSHMSRFSPTPASSSASASPASSTDLQVIQDLGEGLETFFRPGSVTPTTPLVSPSSDDNGGEGEATHIDTHNKKKVDCFVSSSHLFPTASPASAPPTTTAGSTGDGSDEIDVGVKAGGVVQREASPKVKEDGGAVKNPIGASEGDAGEKSLLGRKSEDKSGSSPRLVRGVSSGAVLGSVSEEQGKLGSHGLPPHRPAQHHAPGGATRSRSSDCLEKSSPLSGRRTGGDSPLSTSLLSRRGGTHGSEEATGSGNAASLESVDGIKRLSPSLPKIGVGVGSEVLAEIKARQEKRASVLPKQSSEDSESSTSKEGVGSPVGIGVRLRSTGLSSPTNGIQRDGLPPLSPVLKSVAKTSVSEKQASVSASGPQASSSSKTKPPPIAPKPRPWSVVGSDRKSGEFSLPSDGSSTNTSAANTPDSSGDALDESTDSGVASSHELSMGGEKKSVRELAASLSKGQLAGGTDLSSNKTLEHSPSLALGSAMVSTIPFGIPSSPVALEEQKMSSDEGQTALPAPKREIKKGREEDDRFTSSVPLQGSQSLMTEFAYDDVIDV
ncbi:F-actin-uncapping protein LRRC16A isoform X2 [Ischnura elegans]|uniref:F-actin-uncapping protein LRRC16A isoform X2 n=1 Tax=Ischnura elegans TaxID=197161 RepID=UPI001ED884D2|nr:F-actin-uncapping protein LRRC16A isoform X2 [Ischnura elegans]